MYRLGVGIFLINSTGKVWLGRRIDSPNYWQMPQGGVDPNEDPNDALIRELYEETGIKEDKIKLLAKSELLKYDIPDDVLKDLSWGGKYKGQQQYWYLLKFLGENSDFNLEKHSVAEFSEWKWANTSEILDKCIHFKKDLYRKVLDSFKDSLI